jgi:hypothetical protein
MYLPPHTERGEMRGMSRRGERGGGMVPLCLLDLSSLHWSYELVITPASRGKREG